MMDDVDQARDLIRAIRADLGINDDGTTTKVATIAENSLKLLSEELYSKPTRFLLELIQNADDNKYSTDVTPQLSIVYRRDGYLWMGCNELGFSKANVEAICTVGESTKKLVEGTRKGYIGEKVRRPSGHTGPFGLIPAPTFFTSALIAVPRDGAVSAFAFETLF